MIAVTNQATDIQFSTKYKNISCVSTFDYNNWYHSGSIWIVNTKNNTILHEFKNHIGIHKLSWSEKYQDHILAANHDGSFTMWDANKAKLVVKVNNEEGYESMAINWNNLMKNKIIVGSSSSRVTLFDATNFDKIVSIFSEHSMEISDSKWNPNNPNEFASSSKDGLLKIWDIRLEHSVSTLFDKKNICPLKGLDWHKRDDWIIAVASSRDRVQIWDVRNVLQPIKVQNAHDGIVYDVRFDTTQPDRLATVGKDRVTRIWDTTREIRLLAQHKLHKAQVSAVDWDVYNPTSITTVGFDSKVITNQIDIIRSKN